jgi:hypothetical protein
MRLLTLAATALLSISTPALAQVQQYNPNAANKSLENEGQMRSLQQEGTTRNDTLQMNMEREQTATPSPYTGPSAVGPIYGGTGVRR